MPRAKPGKACIRLSDGGGLQFWVQPNGSRLWQLVYQHQGKQAQMALGLYLRQQKPEAAEIARLKREVTKLKAERDVLKKAAAYFAKEST
jgi:transposase